MNNSPGPTPIGSRRCLRMSARALGVTRPALSALSNEHASPSPEMALRVEKVFGLSMDTLLRMQTGNDIARTRMRVGEIEIVPFEEQLA